MQPRASDRLLCQLIVEAAQFRSLKVARIASEVLGALDSRRRVATCDDFDRCIEFLARRKFVPVEGDAARWRFSEVRLLRSTPFPLTLPTSHTKFGNRGLPSAWRTEWKVRLLFDN